MIFWMGSKELNATLNERGNSLLIVLGSLSVLFLSLYVIYTRIWGGIEFDALVDGRVALGDLQEELLPVLASSKCGISNLKPNFKGTGGTGLIKSSFMASNHSIEVEELSDKLNKNEPSQFVTLGKAPSPSLKNNPTPWGFTLQLDRIFIMPYSGSDPQFNALTKGSDPKYFRMNPNALPAEYKKYLAEVGVIFTTKSKSGKSSLVLRYPIVLTVNPADTDVTNCELAYFDRNQICTVLAGATGGEFDPKTYSCNGKLEANPDGSSTTCSVNDSCNVSKEYQIGS